MQYAAAIVSLLAAAVIAVSSSIVARDMLLAALCIGVAVVVDLDCQVCEFPTCTCANFTAQATDFSISFHNKAAGNARDCPDFTNICKEGGTMPTCCVNPGNGVRDYCIGHAYD